MNHCVVKGERCTKCCEVIRMSDPEGSLTALMKGIHPTIDGDLKFMVKYWKIIPEYKAFEINPHLKTYVQDWINEEFVNDFIYFSCSQLTDEGCGIYENRPDVCRDYPFYNQNEIEWNANNKHFGKYGGEYTENCTYYLDRETSDGT